MQREANPFEDKVGAEEWINTVENERGTIRDREIYPQLAQWINKVNPSRVVDIGAGQGVCSNKLGNDKVEYIGIEPSQYLVDRAEELYKKENRKFIVGSAYAIPLGDHSVDAAFSITTWFHLQDIFTASKELSRILKPKGSFMIITPSPNAYDVWETFYSDSQKQGNLLIGKVDILLNPNEGKENFKFSRLSKNTFYRHSLDEIITALKKSDLQVDLIEDMGTTPVSPDKPIFLKILGHRIN